jgi:hypothetical protein
MKSSVLPKTTFMNSSVLSTADFHLKEKTKKKLNTPSGTGLE